jgi:hypothetical protein
VKSSTASSPCSARGKPTVFCIPVLVTLLLFFLQFFAGCCFRTECCGHCAGASQRLAIVIGSASRGGLEAALAATKLLFDCLERPYLIN